MVTQAPRSTFALNLRYYMPAYRALDGWSRTLKMILDTYHRYETPLSKFGTIDVRTRIIISRTFPWNQKQTTSITIWHHKIA